MITKTGEFAGWNDGEVTKTYEEAEAVWAQERARARSRQRWTTGIVLGLVLAACGVATWAQMAAMEAPAAEVTRR